MLAVRFTRVSPTHHRFEIERTDRSTECTVVETRSLLAHDLLHFALETEAGLLQSFYGLLAAGRRLSETMPESTAQGVRFPIAEAQLTERIVGPLTAVVQDKISPRALLAGIRQLQEAHGEPMQDWLTEELIQRTAARFRRLHGQWKSTAFGQTMQLRFDVGGHRPAK
jgi:hypothetical protein